MTLYQVLRELQIVLAVILGACPLCRQPVTLDRIVEVAAVGDAVQNPAQVDQVPVAPVGAGPADMVLDGVVVLVDRRVDGPRLLMGDVAALAGTEVLFRDPRVGVVREIA